MIDPQHSDPSFPAEDRALVMTSSGELRWSDITSAAHVLVSLLPSGSVAINLCERRENFLIGLMALLIKRILCIVPPSRAPAAVDELLAQYPDGFCLDDVLVAQVGTRASSESNGLVLPDRENALLVAFTSGSTGKPKANPKTWGTFMASARLNARALYQVLEARGDRAMPWILATVPSQHMYGVEMTVLLPLFAGMGIHSANPLYPADIDEALRELPEPRILVTTPAHLRALLQSGIELPRLSAVVCATAQLSVETAQAAETRLGAPVIELFGATETCVIASRRPVLEAEWHLYHGVEIVPQPEATVVSAPWLASSVLLQDVVETRGQDRFVVIGRHSDMVKIAGKRASLAALSRHLTSIPGVVDAVMLQPESSESGRVQRLAALVVADGLTGADILLAFRRLVDPVFLPRPLLLVDHLPRNEVGKLPRESVLHLLRQATRSSRDRVDQP
jgi:acyl-coenzyme A synthetase/AMP-(fatty) acid ligase